MVDNGIKNHVRETGQVVFGPAERARLRRLSFELKRDFNSLQKQYSQLPGRFLAELEEAAPDMQGIVLRLNHGIAQDTRNLSRNLGRFMDCYQRLNEAQKEAVRNRLEAGFMVGAVKNAKPVSFELAKVYNNQAFDMPAN